MGIGEADRTNIKLTKRKSTFAFYFMQAEKEHADDDATWLIIKYLSSLYSRHEEKFVLRLLIFHMYLNTRPDEFPFLVGELLDWMIGKLRVGSTQVLNFQKLQINL